MTNDEWGTRMKHYEYATRQVLPPRTYTIIRVDGRAFHTHLKNADKPFDWDVITAMDLTAHALCTELSGVAFAYTQSDEISVLLTDLEPQTEPWFGGVVQKMASVAASIATVAFNHYYDKPVFDAVRNCAFFDARVFTIPSRIEVANYFRWRQADAIRNAVSMAAQAHFSPKVLHGKTTAQMQELLSAEKDIDFTAEYTERQRRGGVVVREIYTVKRANVQNLVDRAYGRTDRKEPSILARRSRWTIQAAEDFTLDNGGFLAREIPQEPADVLQAESQECAHEVWEATPGGIPHRCAYCGHLFSDKESKERMGWLS